jgi:CSLREA domain-containing protein
MMRLRASLCALLLACIPAAWADSVNVTTVVDEDNVAITNSANTGCSLREALRFMELSAQDRLNGYGGCFAASSSAGSDTVVLQAANKLNSGVSAYQLTLGEIIIRASVSIDGTPSTLLSSGGDIVGNDASLATKQANYPEIRAAAGSRIFTVTHYAPQTPASSPGVPVPTASGVVKVGLTLTDIKLVGCGSNCAANGGIIDVEDYLSLTTSSLRKGGATAAGGAVYVGPGAAVSVSGSDFEDNTAANGAAINLAPNDQVNLNSVNISASLFTRNTATANGGAVIELQPGLAGSSTLVSSTISGNTAVGVRTRPGMNLRNDTIVNNSGGVDWQNEDLSLSNVSMYNSIVAGNPLSATTSAASQDCLGTGGAAGTISNFSYNVLGPATNCDVVLQSSSTNTTANNTGDQQVIAASCPAAGSPGLLCPLPDTDVFNRTHVPRLPVVAQASSAVPDTLWLLSDLKLNLLVNRGSPLLSGGSLCVVSDQRGNAQRPNSCDVGAAAIKAPVSINETFTTPLATTTKNDFIADLGDVELLPGFACTQVTQAQQTPSTTDGCYKVLTAPGKGSFSLNPVTHQLEYTPGSSFYGSDSFSFLVATTLSRYSDNGSDPQTGQFVQVNVVIKTTPVSQAKSSEAKLGASSLLELLALGGLFAVRAWRQQRQA